MKEHVLVGAYILVRLSGMLKCVGRNTMTQEGVLNQPNTFSKILHIPTHGESSWMLLKTPEWEETLRPPKLPSVVLPLTTRWKLKNSHFLDMGLLRLSIERFTCPFLLFIMYVLFFLLYLYYKLIFCIFCSTEDVII